jgi:hypothetical protein
MSASCSQIWVITQSQVCFGKEADGVSVYAPVDFGEGQFAP